MRYLFILLFVLVTPLKAEELSRHVALKVYEAFQKQQEEQTGEAIKLLETIDSTRSYDQAYVQRMLGIFYWQQGASDKAEQALTLAVKQQALDEEQHLDTQRMLAEIQLYQQHFDLAIGNFKAVIRRTTEKAKLAAYWLRVAQAYYALEQWESILDAVSSYRKNSITPEVSALKLQLAAEINLERWKQAVLTTKQLRSREPEQQDWWKQLYSLLLRTGQNREALAVLQQMERAGFVLTQSEITTLAGLYADQNLPAQAAKCYARLNNLNSDAGLLVNQARYWQQAREWDRALLSWEKAVAIDTQHRWSYARLLLQEGHYQQALVQLNQIKKPSEQMLLARVQAHYRLKQFSLAETVANQAYRVAQSQVAREWLDYLERNITP